LWPDSDDARRAHPTPDHFLPLVYTYAVTDARDRVRFPIEGFDYSASMRAVLYA
jgi:4,5-DOPA dioxygenase extradiol